MTSQSCLEPFILKAEAFENVKSQIGFCGIWCGSCVVGNGALKELTKKYEEIIKGYGLKEWAPKTLISKNLAKYLHQYKPCLYVKDV